MTKLPAFQFYPADWRKDLGIQSLSFFERGVWFELLCLMHESEQRGRLILNGRPMPDETIARLIGLDKQAFLKTVTALLDMGVASRDDSGALVSRRMIRDEELRQIRAEAGKKGGNPNLVKQNPTTLVNQIPTPSSSSSFTSSSSEVKTEETPQAAKPKRGSRIPDQFFLTSEMRDYGRQKRPDIDLDLETERFVNYWRAAAGRTATKLDWIAAWRTWILGANQHGKNFGAALAKRNDQDVIRESQDFYNNFS